MHGRLEPLRSIRIGQPVYAVALSGDGQYVAAGSEQGLALYDVVGNCRLAYPARRHPLPVSLVAMVPDMSWLLVGTREGVLNRLEVKRKEGGFTARARILHQALNDLNSLALSADGQIIALGHLSPALTVLQTEGNVLWRRHPDDGNATRSQVWSVALDSKGDTLYVGSASAGINVLAALDACTGAPRASQQLDDRIVRLASLATSGGVVAVVTAGSYEYKVVAYQQNLQEVLWERGFNEPVTALAADPRHDLLAISAGYEGRIMVLEATSGQMLAADQALHSLVNGLAVTNGSRLAAGTQDGHIAWLYYESGGLRL